MSLTIGAEAVAGGAGNDTIVAAYAGTTPAATLSVGDTIDGGAGTDTIRIIKTAAIAQTDVAPTGATVTNVEIAELVSGGAIVANTSVGALTGIATMNATSTGGATITAAATTDINLTDGSVDTEDNGEITVNGGKNVTLTLTAVDGVTNADTNAEIVVGTTTAAAGTVSVTHTGVYVDGTSNVLSDIAVTGGTTISITQNAGVTAAQQTSALSDTTNDTVTLGTATVIGDASTTAVTVNQTAALVENDTATTGQVGIANGDVSVTDANAASGTAAGTIASVTLGSFAAATIDSSALTTVSLSGTGTSLGIGRGALTATPTANTLALNVNGLTTTGAITDSEATADDGFTTINLASSGTASTIASLVAADLTTLNVSGDAKVTITAHTAANLTSVTVTNTGGLDMDGTVLSTAATFTGGAGADAVQLGATTKAITMGAGNDTVVYTAATGTGGSVNAGDGTDIVVMTTALAEAADDSATFNGTYTGFETLRVSNALANSIDVDGINNVSTVSLEAGSNNATINNIDSGGTVIVKADNTTGLTVGVQSAVAGLTDVLNVTLDKTGGVLAFGTLTAANVETININSSDTATNGSAANIHTMTLTAGAAKSVVVTGNNGLNVTATGSTAITSFNAAGVVANSTTASANKAATTDSAANLAVTYQSLNATANAAVSITGGAGNDTLSGSATAVNVDTISGGAGNDTIRGGRGADILDGGAGTADVLDYADVTAATSHGLTNISGMAINLSAASVTASTIATAMTGTIVLGGGAGVAGDALAAGSVGYLATTAANSTATMVRDTVSNFEQVIGSALADYIVGSAGADTITGGLGADYLVGGAGADNFVFTSGLTMDTIGDFVAGTDNLYVSIAALETAGASIAATTLDLVELQDASATAAGDTIVVQEVADQAGGVAVAAGAGANVFVLLTETYANVGAMVDGIETGDHELTTAAGVDVDDAFMVVWSDGTNAYLSIVSVDSGGTADFAAGELVGQNLASLGANAVLVAGEFLAADFAFIA